MVDPAAERIQHQGGALVEVGEVGEPVAKRRGVVRVEQPLGPEGSLLVDGDELQRAVAFDDALGGETTVQILEDLFGAHRRQPVAYDHQRQAALPGAAQHVPRDGVGVPLGRGHEDAQVGGGEQLVGDLAVGDLDRVEIGGVDDGDARQLVVVVADDLQRPVGAGEAGQEVAAVAGGVVRVGPHDRRPGRRSQRPRLGDDVTGERVHERGLAGSRRPDEHHHGRGVEVGQPGQQVVADPRDDLVDERGPVHDVGAGQREGDVGHAGGECLERGTQRVDVIGRHGVLPPDVSARSQAVGADDTARAPCSGCASPMQEGSSRQSGTSLRR